MEEGDVKHGPVPDTDLTVQILLNFDEEVQDRSKHHSGSIYMVPNFYRDLSPSSYTPRVVSIGPLHHQDTHLIGFEVQKATYMHNLLHNLLSPLNFKPEQILKSCVTKVSGLIDQIKACYVGVLRYPDSELVKMMVTDACFILAFIYSRRIRYSPLGVHELLSTHIYLDIIRIENQIPFFVLEDIFECTFSKLNPRLTLADYIFYIQRYCNIFEGTLVMDNSGISTTYDHILGFLHKSYQNPDLDQSRLLKMVKAHSVVELERSGVRFSAERDAKWPMAMELEPSRFPCFPSLWSKPTLKMPVLHLTDGTESIVRNLIIYEQSSQVQTCITSYMQSCQVGKITSPYQVLSSPCFPSLWSKPTLIDTPEDVAKLVKSQVLINGLGSDEKASNLINNMLKEVTLANFYYKDEWKKMDYYNAYWPNLLAELRRKYFSNPWSIIALLAVIVLFVLTVVQTVYGVKAA